MATITDSTDSTEPATPKKPVKLKWQTSANLPTLAKKENKKPANELYESILWRIDSRANTNETLAVGLCGCLRKSGSTMIASNLALQASLQQRGRVLLVDANWRPPGILKTFSMPQTTGLYDVLSGDVSPREFEAQSVSDYLDVMSRGKWDEEQPSNVRSELIADMLSDLKMDYSLIIVDLPNAEDMRSALPLARQLDGTLLVARFEAVKQPQARRILRRIQEDGIEVWGSVLNRHREYIPKWIRERL